MLVEVTLFRQLFRSSKWTWLFGWMFHVALLLVLVLVNYRLRQPAHATRQTEPASISNTTGQLDLPRA